jgi:hypothetical protein
MEGIQACVGCNFLNHLVVVQIITLQVWHMWTSPLVMLMWSCFSLSDWALASVSLLLLLW